MSSGLVGRLGLSCSIRLLCLYFQNSARPASVQFCCRPSEKLPTDKILPSGVPVPQSPEFCQGRGRVFGAVLTDLFPVPTFMRISLPLNPTLSHPGSCMDSVFPANVLITSTGNSLSGEDLCSWRNQRDVHLIVVGSEKTGTYHTFSMCPELYITSVALLPTRGLLKNSCSFPLRQLERVG